MSTQTDALLPEGWSDPESETQAHVSAGRTIRLERKHPLAIRWMHWINFPVLFVMIWSGLLIYWNDSDNAYRHPHAVYRIGLGQWTLFRFFPQWFYQMLQVPYHVTQGLGYHFFSMWIFALNGVAWVLYTAISGEWRFLLPQKQSLREAIQVTLVDLHLRKALPAQTKYNGAQRIAYTSVIFMGAAMLLTGLAIYKPTNPLAHLPARRLRDGAVVALLDHDGVSRILSGACRLGDAGRVEQLPSDGERT